MEKMDRLSTPKSSDLQNAILRTVAYADVFDYPLTSAEIHRYLTRMHAQRNEVEQYLHEGSVVRASEGFYTLPNREGLAAVRHKREQIARRMWPQAIAFGRIIAHLPFVRMIAVTGSLAMSNVEYDPDIDYFIVTARGRLWTVRAMVLAVARLADLQGARLCPNYLVTEDALVFPEQTLYTAHELAQMVPIFGRDVYERICQLNPWKESYLPNAQSIPPVMDQVEIGTRQTVLKSFLENTLQLPPGSWFEQWEMRRKIRRLSREQSSSPESCFAAEYCKGHDLQHGQRTERVFRARLDALNLEATI